jgi:glyoxylase-like metal-dependent hydrolase (beta-lactamase superfamily II)
MWQPAIAGFDRVRCGCWSILITHPPSGQRLLYDLGLRKDWENLAPATKVKDYVASGIITTLKVRQSVSEILSEAEAPEHRIALEEISGVVWSHWHWDHIGDVSTFPESTKLIVGPGTKEAFMPGYPADSGAHTLESDFAGREVIEVDFAKAPLRVGHFEAYDYFGDGSFYLLNAPGHAIGHLNALARTTVDPPTFILLGGDSAHHCGEIRPSIYTSLPPSMPSPQLPLLHTPTCPGHVFSGSVPQQPSPSAFRAKFDGTSPILRLIDPFAGSYLDPKFALIYNDEALRDTLEKDIELDARDEVFVLISHDWSLKGLIPEWPRELNSWAKEGWKEEWRWTFLKDFEGALGDGAVEEHVDKESAGKDN